MTRITPITSILLVLTVAAIADDNPQVLQDATIVETLLRLEDFDLSSSEKAKATVERYLQRERGSERYFELIQKFKIKSAGEDLVALAAERPDETAGVRAVQVLIDHDQAALLASAINDEDEARAADLIAAMGRLGNPKVEQILSLVFADQKRSLAVRSAAARALGRSTQGQKDFLKLAAAGELPDDLKFTVADLLFASNHESIRSEAAKYLRPPASADETPLPPVGLLIKRRGDPEKGKEIFAKKGACAKCHQVGDEGRNVGPALTEIGGKLAKESMYVAILDPNASISHNYENYLVITDDGRQVSGLLISENPQAITIRTAEGIDQTFEKKNVDEVIKQKGSLMPSGLQKMMTVNELVDLVEYLSTLRKK